MRVAWCGLRDASCGLRDADLELAPYRLPFTPYHLRDAGRLQGIAGNCREIKSNSAAQTAQPKLSNCVAIELRGLLSYWVIGLFRKRTTNFHELDHEFSRIGARIFTN